MPQVINIIGGNHMECTGYWETCKCEDCKYAATLYEELEYYNNDPEFEPEIKEIENKLESMGYFV